jgi:23S rRNA (guanosine2251-2'-O)-methyltransferase
MKELVLIAHNLRSSHNIGSLLRTAEGLGVKKVFLTGYSPYPTSDQDTRLPHKAAEQTRQITKTALGAENQVAWEYIEDINHVLKLLRKQEFLILGLEQTDKSLDINSFSPPQRVAIILGREVEGLEPELIAACDILVEIPMLGQKESFNVVQAAAMALFYLQFAKTLKNK